MRKILFALILLCLVSPVTARSYPPLEFDWSPPQEVPHNWDHGIYNPILRDHQGNYHILTAQGISHGTITYKVLAPDLQPLLLEEIIVPNVTFTGRAKGIAMTDVGPIIVVPTKNSQGWNLSLIHLSLTGELLDIQELKIYLPTTGETPQEVYLANILVDSDENIHITLGKPPLFHPSFSCLLSI